MGEVAERLGLYPDEIELHGPYAAKISLETFDRLQDKADGRLVCVTAMTPTKAGEGKTTTAISLVDALASNGNRAALCLREPSVGPVFGIKGGGTGGGLAQVAPMELVNLHFTGDIHAIGAANNLLAAMIDSHLWHGNELGIDPATITWRRCIDMDDRSLRRIQVGLGDDGARETGFDITAASEVMAIVSVTRDVVDLRRRLGAITVAETFEGAPVTAEQLGAAGAMAALLVDAVKPNLVQTLEGRPALVHCGPFANIAHGNNSLLADRLGLKLADYVVTESGFGADMGFEKLVDIVCRTGGIAPSAVVLVATVKALKHHGGDPDGGLDAVERGAENLAANLRIVGELGFHAVVAVNRFPDDTSAELDAAKRVALERGAFAAEIDDGFARGARAPSRSPRRSRRRWSSRQAFGSCTKRTLRSSGRSRPSHGACTAPPASSSPPKPGPRRSASSRRAWATSRSAWPRPISRSRMTPRCSERPRASSSPCGSSAPTRGPAGSSLFAARS